MARPEIPQDQYTQALEQMLADGIRIDDIKPAKLQQAVGGRYNKCAEILESYRAKHQVQNTQDQPPQPAWFKDVVMTTSEGVKRAIEATWFTLHSEMNKTIDLAAEGYDKKKAELKALRDEDRKQIDLLEAKLDELSETLIQKDAEITRLKETFNLAQASAREAQAVTEERRQRIESLEIEVKEAREQTAQAEKQTEHLAVENQTLQNLLDKEQQQYQRQLQKFTQTEQSTRDLRMESEALKREQDKQKDEYKRQFKKFTETEQAIQDLRIDHARTQDRYESAEKRASELSGQVKKFQERLFKLAEDGQKARQQKPPTA